MYKTKLQELCQRKSWSLPEYQMSREGPDHNPRFISTITINGLPFQTPSPCRTAKEAQNITAKLAFDHFSQPNPSLNPPSSPLPPLPKLPSLPGFTYPQPSLSALSLPHPSATSTSPSGSPGPSSVVDNILPTSMVLQPNSEEACQTTAVRDTMTAADQKNMLHLYKNQLQSYAQKRNLNLPVYSPEWEGPPHAMRFKCKVTIDGQTYESPTFFSTLKDAEHAAAEVALMTLLPGGVQEDHTGLYKNLLQEFVQKEGIPLPVYSTNKSGEAHMPIFLSQVEVEGELFTGQEAKSKKLAEMSAAKVAYTTLKERKGKSDQSSLFPLSAHQGQPPEFLSDHTESNVTVDLQHQANQKSPASPGLVTQNQPNNDNEPVVTVKRGSSSSGNTDCCAEDTSLSNSSSPPLSDGSNVVSDTSNMPSAAVGSPSRRRKVVVYSRNTNVKIEEGGTLMPISDDKWVAYSYSQ